MEQRTPRFTDMRFLKNEILRTLRDFPRDIVELLTAPYSDGVVTGLDLTVNAGTIVIAPGIVKHQGRLLLSKERLEVPYLAKGQKQILKIIFDEPYEEPDFVGQKGTISLESGVECKDNEMELARFQLEPGAYLRSEYQDLLDFSTGYNTFNLVHQPYSGYGGVTINPAVLRYFARELCSYHTENAHDLNICYQVLNHGKSISSELLDYYFSMRLKRDIVAVDNPMRHQYLVQILQMAKQEQRHIRHVPAGGRKLIVD